MGILEIKADSRVAGVSFTTNSLAVRLKDGRQISAPLDWFPRLKSASSADRENWETCAAGHGIHWPKIDEDLSIDGLLRVTSGDK